MKPKLATFPKIQLGTLEASWRVRQHWSNHGNWVLTAPFSKFALFFYKNVLFLFFTHGKSSIKPPPGGGVFIETEDYLI